MSTFQMAAVAAGGAVGVLLLFVGLISLVQRSRLDVERLQSFVAPAKSSVGEETRVGGVLSDIDHWVARRKFGASIARDLAQADIKLTVSEYILIHAGAFALGLVIGPMLFKSPLAGILLACILLFMPKMYVANAKGKRRNAFADQLPGALNSIANSLRGGYGLVQAMTLLATEMGAPMSVEFQRVVSEVSYGLPYDIAFRNMLRRNPSADLSMVVTAIEINLEVGGNLSDILDNISAIIRDRVRIQGQVRAFTATTRLSSTVLTFLPFAIGGIMFLVNPTYLSELWRTKAGIALLMTAGCFLAAGVFALNKLSKIEV
jgi:tight adherence protein B